MNQGTNEFGIDPQFLPPESLWLAIESLLPEPKARPKGGRPPMPNRAACCAIFYIMRTGMQRQTGHQAAPLDRAAGLPIGVVVTGANRHDKTRVEAVFESMPVPSPVPGLEQVQHFCADKGYDYDDVRAMLRLWGLEDHIKSRGEERLALAVEAPGFRALRWVCERTHSWMNRFRRLLIRWEHRLENFMAFLHLACAFIVWRNCPVFG